MKRSNVLALEVVGEPAEVLVRPDARLEYAWAMFVRVYSRGGPSWRKPVTGAFRGTAPELLATRREALATADRQDWMETLHLDGRAIIRAWLAETVRISPDDLDHDCDCTCAGEPGHLRWEERPARWRAVKPFEVLQRLSWTESVRVQLGPGTVTPSLFASVVSGEPRMRRDPGQRT